eukprot:CAMPEP_0119513410 /NCGR_PEP_ID=MMETSP1344-20130328/31532_1 /TAXON_ID=236787 /ORGANISM="Florenciella parvula, Strain CCMP2471" /LENGTH=134 /DNA_ID=CAMNT_0007550635 /DNA_START=865 /DNA_END=1266 /DNA_ORIENTATION=-
MRAQEGALEAPKRLVRPVVEPEPARLVQVWIVLHVSPQLLSVGLWWRGGGPALALVQVCDRRRVDHGARGRRALLVERHATPCLCIAAPAKIETPAGDGARKKHAPHARPRSGLEGDERPALHHRRVAADVDDG